MSPWAGGITMGTISAGCLRGLAETLGFDLDTPWEALLRGRRLRSCTATDQVHVPYAQQVRRRAVWKHQVRGHLPTSSVGTGRPSPRGAREVRGLHARGAVLGLCRHPLKPAGARRCPHRQLSIVEVRWLRRRVREGLGPGPVSSTPSSGRSPSGCSRSQAPGGFLLDVGLHYLPSTGRRARCRAARLSASAWPPRSAPAWWGCSTCSTSRRSASTSATTSA